MEISIKKLKLRDGMFPTIEYDEVHGSATDEVTKVCNNPAHDDLKDKLQALSVHCVLITELVDITKVKGDIETFTPPLLNFITVKGLTIGGDSEEGITISFERKLSTGRVLNLNTPFTKFNDDQIKYKFDDDLQLCVEDLKKEVELYLGGKFGEGAQLEMAFEGADETNPHL